MLLAAVDAACITSKTGGFRYDARVFVAVGWKRRQLLIGSCLETIIREADVRHTVDLPPRD